MNSRKNVVVVDLKFNSISLFYITLTDERAETLYFAYECSTSLVFQQIPMKIFPLSLQYIYVDTMIINIGILPLV